MRSKAAVLKLIRASMEAQGWPLLHISDLPLAFAHDTLVTPYFRCSDVPKRPFGKYIVEGVIGVIHQGFEQGWIENSLREPKVPGFGAALHIANFRELGDKFYIPCEGSINTEIDALCAAGSWLPNDEKQLVTAVKKGEMCGGSITRFAGYSHRKKFAAFKEFVTHLGTQAHA